MKISKEEIIDKAMSISHVSQNTVFTKASTTLEMRNTKARLSFFKQSTRLEIGEPIELSVKNRLGLQISRNDNQKSISENKITGLMTQIRELP
jgi:hypothetical protein